MLHYKTACLFVWLSLFSVVSSTDSLAQSQRRSGPEQVQRQISLSVVNASDSTVNNLYVTPVNSLVWGDDRLGDATIKEEGRFALKLERGDGCNFDILVVYADGKQDVDLDVNLCAARSLRLDGSKELSIFRMVGASQRSPIGMFVVHNRTKADMTGVTINPGAPNEAVLLKGPTIKPGNRTIGRFRRGDGCMIQLSAEFKEADAQIVEGHDVCKTPIVVLNPPPEPVSVKFRNRGSYPLNSLFVRPKGIAAWGEDRLESSTVTPRDIHVLKLSPTRSCLFDLKIVISGADDEIRSGLNLCSGALIDVFGPDIITGRGQGKADKVVEVLKDKKPLAVLNESTRPIKELFVSSSRTMNWGDNLLVTPMAPGARFVADVERGDQCLFDIRIVYEGGREQRQMNRDICRPDDIAFGGQTVSRIEGGGPESGHDVSFVNDGRTPLQSLFLTPASDSHWGDDRLGTHTLGNKMRLDLRLAKSAGCLWDIKLIYQGDISREQRGQDLCATPLQSLFLRDKPGTLVSTGTGFHVSDKGHILTNHHVIEGCNRVLIARDGQPGIPLKVIRSDEEADLALLTFEQPVAAASSANSRFISFRKNGNAVIRAGERVIVIGYPVRSKLGGVNITEGVVSSLRGPDKDATRMQYTAPSQPGNSGGPILDQAGLAIGVVVARMTTTDDNRTAQNINFGVSLATVTAFLQSANIPVDAPKSTANPLTTPEILEAAGDAIVPLDCLD